MKGSIQDRLEASVAASLIEFRKDMLRVRSESCACLTTRRRGQGKKVKDKASEQSKQRTG